MYENRYFLFKYQMNTLDNFKEKQNLVATDKGIYF